MTKVYGASDDLVEFEGDVSGEVSHFSGGSSDPIYLIMSDGTVLQMYYDDEGVWRITLKRVGTHFVKLEFCRSPDDSPHSDVAHFKDGLSSAWSTRELDVVR